MRGQKLSSVAVVLGILAVATPAMAAEFKPYGYIKADMSMDLGDNFDGHGNWARWVAPKTYDANGDEADKPTTLSIHARQSRIGFDFIGDKVKDVQVMGRFESDFTNGGGEYTYIAKLRKAYLKLSTPTLELLAGQESDIISPLVPSTVNYLVGWWQGDIGFRRPQVRLTYKHAMGKESGLDFTVGVLRGFSSTIAANNQDVAVPVAAARIGYRSPAFSAGVSGHYGQERERFAQDGATEDFDDTIDSYSANVDFKLKFGKRIGFSGEFHYGQNLDTYLGGIGQGVVRPVWDGDGKIDEDAKAIRSMGFWAMLSLAATDRMKLNLGVSMDMPNEDDLNEGMRSRNMHGFGNVTYLVAKDFSVALEAAYWKTDYKDTEADEDAGTTKDNDLIRGQLAFIYKF